MVASHNESSSIVLVKEIIEITDQEFFNTCIMQNGSAVESSLVEFPAHLIPRSGSDAVKSVAPFSITILEK